MNIDTGSFIIFIDAWRPRRRFVGRCLRLWSQAAASASSRAAAPPPPAVTVAKPVKRTVFDYDEYVGRFVAVNSVEVRARVSGYLDGVHFKDGQIVKQGDLLFTIDKRPFQNTLDQARANLAQAKSNLAFTEADLHARPATGARQDHHRPDLRAAHAGLSATRKPRSATTRRRCARPSSISNSPNCARRSTAASATAASRPAIW